MDNIANVKDFFSDSGYHESVLISYNFNLTSGCFSMVTDIINWNLPRGEREFRKTVFYGVNEYNEQLINNLRIGTAGMQFKSKDYRRTVILQDVSVNVLNDYYSVILNYGVNFGCINFQFTSVEFEKKIGRGEKVKGEWVYQDIKSKENFDFYKPFD